MVDTSQLKAIGVIPARYGSTRFPGKSLALIQGKPMIQWVCDRAGQATTLSQIIVATDDQRIIDAVAGFGGTAVMTAVEHKSGTDRVAEVAEKFSADIIVNIQGDEPLIDPAAIDAAVLPFAEYPYLNVTTLVTPFTSETDWRDENVVKAVRDDDGAVLYFSRSPIPYPRCNSSLFLAKKHIGLYAYRREFLRHITRHKPHPLEIAEGLEQLRILALGEKILGVETDYDSIGVDVPEDIAKVEARLSSER